MGFWSENIDSPFDSVFDFNGDGRLDPVERGIQMDFLNQQMDEDERSRKYENYYDNDNDDDF